MAGHFRNKPSFEFYFEKVMFSKSGFSQKELNSISLILGMLATTIKTGIFGSLSQNILPIVGETGNQWLPVVFLTCRKLLKVEKKIVLDIHLQKKPLIQKSYLNIEFSAGMFCDTL